MGHTAEHQHLFIPFCQPEQSANHAAHAAAQLQCSALSAGAAAAKVRHHGGNENQRCHLYRQFRLRTQRRQHHVGSLVILVMADAIEPDDQQTAQRQQTDHPPMPQAEPRCPLDGIHKSDPDKAHQNPHQHRIKHPAHQQPQMRQNVNTAMYQPSLPAGEKIIPGTHTRTFLLCAKHNPLKSSAFQRIILFRFLSINNFPLLPGNRTADAGIPDRPPALSCRSRYDRSCGTPTP